MTLRLEDTHATMQLKIDVFNLADYLRRTDLEDLDFVNIIGTVETIWGGEMLMRDDLDLDNWHPKIPSKLAERIAELARQTQVHPSLYLLEVLEAWLEEHRHPPPQPLTDLERYWARDRGEFDSVEGDAPIEPRRAG